MYQLAMRKLAEVHGRVLGDGVLAAMHDNTYSYWQEVVSAGHVMTEANSIVHYANKSSPYAECALQYLPCISCHLTNAS